MSPDLLSTSMFWVGALFVFTPLVVGGTVIGIWWYQKKKAAPPLDSPPEA